jgi:hypothetical protein
VTREGIEGKDQEGDDDAEIKPETNQASCRWEKPRPRKLPKNNARGSPLAFVRPTTVVSPERWPSYRASAAGDGTIRKPTTLIRPATPSRPMCQPKISCETEGGGVRGASCANVGTHGPLSLRNQQILASSFADGL